MKTIVTLTFTLLLSFAAFGQSAKKEVKVTTITKGIVLNIDIKKSDVQSTEVARLYMYKNARVKKALNFSTRARKAKMA